MSHYTARVPNHGLPPEGRLQASRFSPRARRVDVPRLARAMVFTKGAYHTLRAKVLGKSQKIIHPQAIAAAGAAAHVAADAPRAKGLGAGVPALTPWDMMDEDDSMGVAFTQFQRRHGDAIPKAA